MRNAVLRIVFVAFVFCVLICAAILGVLYYQGTRKSVQSAQYVALGSSFAAGIGLGPREPDSPFVCFRSTEGYPHLLASMTGFSLSDMSCSGSTTEHILRGGQIFQRPQMDAIAANTQLVTITSGGNDVNYVGDLLISRAGGPVSRIVKAFGTKRAQNLDRVRRNLRQIVLEIRKKAPGAKIVLVTYPAIVPPAGTCAQLGVDDSAADRARRTAAQLRDATALAAKETGATLVDMAQDEGHNACSAEPWVNGANPKYGAAFHPNRAGAVATAKEVYKAIH